MKYNSRRFEIIVLVVGLLAIGLLAICADRALAQDNPFSPYGANYMMPGYFPDGSNLHQFKFQLSQQFDVLRLDELWPGVAVRGAYEQTSYGDVEEQSAPFYHDFKPSLWLEKLIGEGTSLRYGWVHGSTGVADTDSRSWDRQFVAWDVLFDVDDGAVTFDLHPMLWWAFDVADDNADILDIRALDGRFGAELRGRVLWREGLFGWDWLTDAAWGKNQLSAQLGVNTIPWVKDWFLTGQLFNGTGNSLVDYQQPATDFGVGVTFVPQG